jgi:hypothetical protein
MGLPTTWVTLCMVHLFWVQSARRASDSNKASTPVRICGDDLIGLFTPRLNRAYLSVVERSGGKFSVGKHYASMSDSRGKLRGIFTEEIFSVQEEQIVDKRPHNAVSVLVPVGEVRTRRVKHGRRIVTKRY